MITKNESEPKPRGWRQILAHEFFEYLFNFAFLSFFLVAFAWYRRLTLAAYHIQIMDYWVPLVEAAILAKVIMIGDILHMGRKFRGWPLAVPVIYRTVVFSLLVVVFSVLEHVVGAWVHGKSAADGIAEITNKGWYELLACCVLMNAAFLPFFAVKEIERIYGAETIRRMFFSRHVNEVGSPIGGKGSTAKPTL